MKIIAIEMKTGARVIINVEEMKTKIEIAEDYLGLETYILLAP